MFEIITPLVDTDMTRGRMDDAVKMSPNGLAREVIRNMEKDRYEIKPGRAKVMLFLNRVFPSLLGKAFGKR